MSLVRITALVLVAAISFPAVTAAETAADRELVAAESAIDAQQWEKALAALERAFVARPDPYYLYRRILVLEQMGENALALEVLRENRASLLESDRVNDLVVVEERLQAVVEPVASSDVGVADTAPVAQSNPWPVVSLAGGTAIAATGGVLLFLGARNMNRLRCADVAAGGATCTAPSELGPLSQSDFETRVAEAGTLRAVGAVLLPVGLAVGIGGFLLTSRQGEPARARLGVSGSGLTLFIDFF